MLHNVTIKHEENKVLDCNRGKATIRRPPQTSVTQ